MSDEKLLPCRRQAARIKPLPPLEALRITVDVSPDSPSGLVWALTRNEDPWPHEVDHVDGDGANNSPENLRLATSDQNKWNTAPGRHVGLGTYLRPSGRYGARIRYRGITQHIGAYDTEAEAAAAYRAEAARLRGEFLHPDIRESPQRERERAEGGE